MSARFDRTAAGYAGGGGTTARRNISAWISADLACVVDLEEPRLHRDDVPTVFVYRTARSRRLGGRAPPR